MTSRPRSFSLAAFLVLGVPLGLLAACTAGQNLGTQGDGGTKAKKANGIADVSATTDGTDTCTGDASTCCGSPVACHGRFEGDCAQSGCTWTPQTCSGVAAACSQFPQLVCAFTPGCRWEEPGGVAQCVGTAVPCGERMGNCDAVDGASGCLLVGGCTGTPRSCSAYSSAECAGHEGCGTTSSASTLPVP